MGYYCCNYLSFSFRLLFVFAVSPRWNAKLHLANIRLLPLIDKDSTAKNINVGQLTMF